MAKQLVNPIERHVEKAVLGAAGLVLVSVVVLYAVSSPNQLELGGERVSPSDIDSVLAQQAGTVRDRILRTPSDVPPSEPLFDTFVAELDPYQRAELPLSLPTVVAMGPPIPLVDAAEGGVFGRKELVAVVPTAPPLVTHGRSTFRLRTESGDLYPPANWVTVSVSFDVKEQMDRQRRTYGAMLKEVAFGRPELQRRARRVDGSWSDADWEDVEPWSLLIPDMPTEPEIVLLPDGDELVVADRVLDDLEIFFAQLNAPQLQLALLRPVLPPVVKGDRWDFPIVTSLRDVLDQDDYYLNPEQPPASDPFNRYQPDEGKEATVEVLTDAQRIARTFEEIDRLLRSARENLSTNEATRAYNLAFDLARDAAAGRNDKTRATRKMEEADETLSDIRRDRRTGVPKPGRTVDTEEEFKREPPETQQIWVHDVRPASLEGPEAVESGATYQYRIRPVITNRLAGRPEKLQNSQDATALFVPGEWSEPVEVAVEPDSRFFVTTEDPRNKEVGIEFFKWFEGNWYKSRRAKFDTGAPLQDKQRIEVESFFDAEKTERAEVDFGADATVLDIDFDRTYRERRQGNSRAGVKFGPLTSACCVTLADSQGRLTERFVATDKGHPDRRTINVWSGPRKD